MLQYVTNKTEFAVRGKSIELFCIFGGTPLPETIWSKGGNRIRYSERVTLKNYGKSLFINSVDFEDEGNYTCNVTNGVKEAISYSIDLQVTAVPYFTEEPEIVNATENETVEFRCAAFGVPEPEIKWTHNGKPIVETPNPRRRVNSNSVVIERVTMSDIGNYGCNATNSLGYIYKDVYVMLPVDVRWMAIGTDENVSVPVGTDKNVSVPVGTDKNVSVSVGTDKNVSVPVGTDKNVFLDIVIVLLFITSLLLAAYLVVLHRKRAENENESENEKENENENKKKRKRPAVGETAALLPYI